MHGTIPSPATESTMSIRTRTFADYDDAVDAEKHVKLIVTRLRALCGASPRSNDHDFHRAVSRLARIGQRATVAADPQSRTRTRSGRIAGVIFMQHPDGSESIGFCEGHTSFDRGCGDLTLRRDESGWKAY